LEPKDSVSQCAFFIGAAAAFAKQQAVTADGCDSGWIATKLLKPRLKKENNFAS